MDVALRQRISQGAFGEELFAGIGRRPFAGLFIALFDRLAPFPARIPPLLSLARQASRQHLAVGARTSIQNF
jgi:hypothetical protein